MKAIGNRLDYSCRTFQIMRSSRVGFKSQISIRGEGPDKLIAKQNKNEKEADNS